MTDRNDQIIAIEALALSMVRAIVDQPATVTHSSVIMSEQVIMEVFVADSDMGLALGRDGSNMRLIRELLYLASKKCDFRFSISVVSIDRRKKVIV
jgi:predicted RNA-binding protein YlqC (UPF0109 family)